LVLFSGVTLLGCQNTRQLWSRIWGSSTGDGDEVTVEDDTSLLDRGQERMDADDYVAAAEIFQQLKDQFPQSLYAAYAELRLGDAYYLEGKYEEARATYESFNVKHPINEGVAYAIYQMGMCNFQRIKGIDHDQTPTAQSLNAFRTVIERFPESPYASMAEARIHEAQNILSGHEFYVGEYYFKRKDYAAAMRRFKGLIERFPDSGYHQQAMTYIAHYRDMLARGEIDEGNQRPSEYDSPFTQPDNSGLPF
jgi:outer membrane protein assembly factor BamD